MTDIADIREWHGRMQQRAVVAATLGGALAVHVRDVGVLLAEIDRLTDTLADVHLDEEGLQRTLAENEAAYAVIARFWSGWEPVLDQGTGEWFWERLPANGVDATPAEARVLAVAARHPARELQTGDTA